MKTISFAAAGILAGMMVSSAATAAELRVLAGGAMTAVWAALKPHERDPQSIRRLLSEKEVSNKSARARFVGRPNDIEELRRLVERD